MDFTTPFEPGTYDEVVTPNQPAFHFKQMKKYTLVIVSAIVVLIFALLLGTLPRPLSEAERIAVANKKYYNEIFERCKAVPDLRQFVELFNPTEALEFYDRETMKTVVSVCSVAKVNDRFSVTLIAPVHIAEDGYYELTGIPTYIIKDSEDIFTEIYPNSTSTGHSLNLRPSDWQKLYEAKGDFEALRVVHRSNEG